jgi:23S rRNA (cytidine2498-2'-O)-methyltransferase
MMSKDAAQFVFMTCRPGAERAVKEEVARVQPEWRFSFSRPGFLTFKHAGEEPLDERRLAERHWTFAHAHGISLGRVIGEQLAELAARVWNQPAIASLAAKGGFAAIHVWEVSRPAEGIDDEPPMHPLCDAIDGALRYAAPESYRNLRASSDIRRPARRNGRVLDVMVLAPGEWWVGYHRAVQRHERWAGGVIAAKLPEHAVSRAYIKMVEALAWSDLPLAAGDECVEIGCAPGGASQALLERGLFVTGIDPAEVDPAVLAHPRFRHLKKRGKDVRRKEFEGVRWLVADMNIAPETTLSEVETIVTHPGLAFRGLVLTLKFSDWNLAARLPEFTARVRGWGFRDVRARQLTSGGQEVCLVALKRKALRRVGAKLNRKRKSRPKVTRRKDGSHSTLPGPHF